MLSQTVRDSVITSLKKFQKHVYVNNDSAYYYLKQAKFIAMGNPDELVIVYGKTSDYYTFVVDDLDVSLAYLDKAISLRSKIKDTVSLAQIYNRRGYVLKILWNIEEAFSSYNKAIKILKDAERPKLLSNSYVKKGRLYTAAGLFPEAFAYFEKAMELAEKNEKVSKSFIYRSIGQAYKVKGDFDEAEAYFEKAIEIIKKRKNSKRNQAEFVLNNSSLAALAYEKGEYIKALQLALGSEKWIKNVKNKKKLAGLHLLMGKLYYEFENDSLALQYTRKAYEKAVQKNVAKQKVESAKQLVIIYERLQNVDKAYKFLQQYENFKSEYAIEEAKQTLMKATFLATIAEKDEMYEAVTQENEANKKFYTMLSVLLSVGLGLLFFIFYKRKKYTYVKQLQKSKTHTIRIKQNLVATQKKMLQTQNELNAYTRLITQQTNPKTNVSLVKVKETIHQLYDIKILTEEDWLRFKTLFVNIHPNFYKNFKVNVDDYSLGDLKLASLIRLNFNTKEIANILAISPESVRKGKYRLRKKMTLTSEKELQKFIYTL